MNSLSFCVTLPTLQTQPTKLRVNKNAATINAEHKTVNNNNAVSVSHHQTQTTSLFGVNENPNLVKRREAILGGAASIGIISSSILFLPSQFEIAEASEVSSPCEFSASPSGLAFCDKVIGNGAQAIQGQLIKAHYTGKLENGKVFDSSYNRGKPLTFRVGAGEVIKGWDRGILGTEGVPPMLAGGKRTLMIPPELGYGVRGAGCRGGTCIIPPNSVLIFDVEFLGKA